MTTLKPSRKFDIKREERDLNQIKFLSTFIGSIGLTIVDKEKVSGAFVFFCRSKNNILEFCDISINMAEYNCIYT